MIAYKLCRLVVLGKQYKINFDIMIKIKTESTLVHRPATENLVELWWVRTKKSIFGFTFYDRIEGDHKIDDSYGELGDMPFFIKKEAEQRIKQKQ